jgi:phenylalanyl-tRNA synthetase beta subunit
LTLQSPSATLTEEEISRYLETALKALATETSARLR